MPSIEAESPLINPAEIDEPHIHVVAAILWQSEYRDRFLIAQRPAGKHLAGYWEFPGGKVEAGESVEAALARELEEEIGVQVERYSPLIRVYFRYPERNVLLDTWQVECFRGNVESREGQALNWIGLEQVDDYQFPPADRPILEAIANNATTGTRRSP